jgi:Tol biopolymer transport system component
MIAYASGDSYELSLVVLSLENRKKLKVIHNYRNHSTSTFCWNPRGEEIAYEAEGGDIWIASIKEGWEMQFTSGKGVKRHPTWSKQGKIAFSWDKEGNFDIWEKDDSGFGDAIQITQAPEDERCPIYSPSGERLMYIGKRGGIFVISLKDRGIIEVLKSRPFGGKVCWAPDGVRIAYDIFSRFGNYRNIWIVQIGNAPRRVGGLYLTKKKYSIKIATNRDPTWSQDGQKLAFTSDREGNENIYVIEVPLN